MTVLLDSWCWIEYFNGSTAGKKVSEWIDSDQQIFVSVINLAEVYKKALGRSTKDADSMINMMMSRSFIIPLEPEMALNAAKINSEKKWGLGDSLIFASAKAHKLKLVTGDPHFRKENEVIYVGK